MILRGDNARWREERGRLKTIVADYRGSIKDFEQSIILYCAKDSSYCKYSSIFAKLNCANSYNRLGDNSKALMLLNQCIKAGEYIEHIYEGKTKTPGANPSLALPTAYQMKGMILIQEGKKIEGCELLSKSGERGNNGVYELIKKWCQ